MDFFINQHATLPILKLELIQDGRNDFRHFHDLIQNSHITFCMTEVSTGIKKIGNKEALCIYKEPTTDTDFDEYYIGYQFSEKDTKKAGSYVGKFTIEFLDGSGILIVPIKEELFIHVLEGSIKK